MRDAAFFPVVPYFFADKGFRIFASNVTPGAELAPHRQYFSFLSPLYKRLQTVIITLSNLAKSGHIFRNLERKNVKVLL
jgi:hypothetical protein